MRESRPTTSFDGAHDFTIKRAKFISTVNNIVLSPHIHDRGRELLNKAQAIEASHSSTTFSSIPKCLPGTRETVIAAIKAWVRQADEGATPESILWFSGPAGGGKTAIMKNIVEDCRLDKELLVASYFFSSSAPELAQERPFVATISHQLTTNPILERLILQTLYRRPSVLQGSLDHQMERLVIDPLESTDFRESSPPKVIIAIDGFDECREKKERKHLLQLLQGLVERLPQSILIILTCRPEFDIRCTFSKSLKPFTHSLQLQDYDGTKDTGVFMREKFDDICENNLLDGEFPDGWPGELIDLLLDKSSGLFAFPSTLMEHVGNPDRNPVEALNEVLALPQPPSSSPIRVHLLEELNTLYSLILRPAKTDLGLMKRLLHTVLGVERIHDHDYYHSPQFLDDFLSLSPGTTNITFRHLHSVLSFPRYKSGPIRFHHKSMQDYLIIPECHQGSGISTPMYRAPSETLADLADLTTRNLNDWEMDPESHPHSISFAALYWGDIIVRLMLQDQPTLAQVILEFDPRIVLKCLFVDGIRGRSSPLKSAGRTVHSTMCRSSRCLTLCRLLSRVEVCWRACLRPAGGAPAERQDRLNALPRICEDTGLYAPFLSSWDQGVTRLKGWLPCMGGG